MGEEQEYVFSIPEYGAENAADDLRQEIVRLVDAFRFFDHASGSQLVRLAQNEDDDVVPSLPIVLFIMYDPRIGIFHFMYAFHDDGRVTFRDVMNDGEELLVGTDWFDGFQYLLSLLQALATADDDLQPDPGPVFD